MIKSLVVEVAAVVGAMVVMILPCVTTKLF